MDNHQAPFHRPRPSGGSMTASCLPPGLHETTEAAHPACSRWRPAPTPRAQHKSKA